MNYLKGIGINILLSVAFTFLMTISTFTFLIVFQHCTISDEGQLLVENIIKLVSALVVYFIVTKLFLNNNIRQYANKHKILTVISIVSSILLLLIVYFLQDEINSIFKYGIVAISMLLTGYSEELIYRYLSFKFYPKGILSVVLQAIIFAFIGHGIVTDFGNNLVYRFPIGFILGIIYVKTKSLGVVGYLHGTYDLLVYCNVI